MVEAATARIAPGPGGRPGRGGSPGRPRGGRDRLHRHDARRAGRPDRLRRRSVEQPAHVGARPDGPVRPARSGRPDRVAQAPDRLAGPVPAGHRGPRPAGRRRFHQARRRQTGQDPGHAVGQHVHRLLFEHTIEGLYASPEYGGNRGLVGWKEIGFPGDVQPRGYTATRSSVPTAPTRWTTPASWPTSSSSSAPCNHDMTKAIVIGSGAGGSVRPAMELAPRPAGTSSSSRRAPTTSGRTWPAQARSAPCLPTIAWPCCSATSPSPTPRSSRAPGGRTPPPPPAPAASTSSPRWSAAAPCTGTRRCPDSGTSTSSSARPWARSTARTWPTGRSPTTTSRPTTERGRQLIGVQGDTATFPDLVHKHAPPHQPVPDAARAADARVDRDRRGHGRHRAAPLPFPMAANSVSGYNGQHACNNCGFCSSFGCPVVARPSALVPLRQALRTGRVELKPGQWLKINLSGSRAKRHLGHDDGPRGRNRHRDRRRRGHGRVRHRDRAPRPALGLPRPQRQARRAG